MQRPDVLMYAHNTCTDWEDGDRWDPLWDLASQSSLTDELQGHNEGPCLNKLGVDC